MLFTELDPGAFIIARILEIPIASTYASVMKRGIGTFPWKRLKKASSRVLKAYGKPAIEPQELSAGQNVLKVIPSIPELEDSIPVSPEFVFTGSLLKSFKTSADQSFQIEEGRRYVFVYVGTGSITQMKLRQILPEVFPAGSPTICLVGAQSLKSEERIGNVIFRPYFDAESLMPHCDWVICHGGHNTMIQSLMNHVPLLIFPGPIFERRFNAEMLQRSGAGVFGELPDFNQEWLKNVFAKREACALKAAEMGEKIKGYGGAGAAIKAMEEFCRRR
jgi:UDP:flavonoid glycosyltransferase YjiC (YdhE family)